MPNNDAVDVFATIILFGILLSPFIITVLKGKWGLALVGVVIGGLFLWIPGAIRLAKPDSYWARRFYDEEKLAQARERFPQRAAASKHTEQDLPSAPPEV